ncbi:histidine phosphotransferase family protein [Sulfitobacter sp. SK011]|uniref:histidine phosphotransferase family protein n=1 Tax=Sulfitobacter sp. SK011 TaxID=1389004 RepID=UPI000E0AAEC8|nr:histidine phosphotransferase family protein [Sulfitobacter sp. SK011]AXI44326.1 histidine phosphotransferase [Sulfitobacter sp. SK011]
MVQDNINLATLIGSRICHDLISPIGAINNGLELLSMADNPPAGPEMELIGTSVDNASARIRFFRIGFGAAGHQMVGRAEITSILRDLYQDSRLTLEWLPEEPQPRAAVRLAFLAIMCLETAMPYGGRAEVSEAEGKWMLKGTADKLNVDPTLWGILAEQSPDTSLQPAHVQFALLPKIAGDDGRRIRSSSNDTSVTIQF